MANPSEQKFTEGPWTAIRDFDGDHGIWAGSLIVAVTSGLHSVPEDEDAANAALIAAAPKLVEALQACAKWIRDTAYDATKVAELVDAEAALKKAGL